MEAKYKKGTTTVGIITKDSIILAADKRASLGHLAMHKSDKINKITEFIGLTQAGAVADSQLLVKYLKAELKLFALDNDIEPTIEIASSMLSSILYGGKGYFPFMVAMLLGGKDRNGNYKLYSLFGDGSSIQDNFTVTGSGMELALGVIEVGYKEGMSTDEGIQLGIRAIKTAIKRDVYSGEGVDVAVIDKDGFRYINEKTITAALKK